MSNDPHKTELLKEAGNWGRLCLQYAFIANGGALTSLPFLYKEVRNTWSFHSVDFRTAALWFAAGIAFAAIASLSAYVSLLSNFQNASKYWLWISFVFAFGGTLASWCAFGGSALHFVYSIQ